MGLLGVPVGQYVHHGFHVNDVNDVAAGKPSHSGPHGAIRGPTTHVRRELQLRPRVVRRVPRRRLTEVATRSPSRAVDVPSGHRPVLSFWSYALAAFLSVPLLASSLTCQRQQSPVFAGRLHPRGDLTGPYSDIGITAKRGTRDRQRCDARREGAKHRRDGLPARKGRLWASRPVVSRH